MTEGDFLAALRALPLHPGAHGLSDDTATLGGYTLTTDTLVEGVHFLTTDPPGDVAWKLIATNLSDLAAKGATPVGVLLNYPLRALSSGASPAKAGVQSGNADDEGQADVTLTSATGPRPLPGKRDEAEEGSWDAAFLTGLSGALTHFATPLLGGDTVSLPANAPRVLTLTAIGEHAPAPPRSGARAGDALYVTGTIGDGGAGLTIAKRLAGDPAGLAIAQGAEGPADLLQAYRRPQPRLAEGRALAPHVHAMMDISDGLLIDAQRMANASNLAVHVDLAAIPLSIAYVTFAGADRPARLAAATAGDDYQLLFAAPADFAAPVPVTCVGRFFTGAGLTLQHGTETLPLPPRLGYSHHS